MKASGLFPGIRGLTAKFLVVLIPVFGAFSLAAVYLVSASDRGSHSDQLASRVGVQAARVAAAIGRYEGLNDRRLLDDLLVSLHADPAVLCAEIRRSETNELFISRPPVVGCRDAGPGTDINLPAGDSGRLSLHLVVSAAEIVKAEERHSATILAVIAAALSIAVVAAVGVFRWIVGKPLSRLHQGIRAISDSGVRVPVPGAGNDELGEIIAAFNRMTELEDRREREIADLNRSLESKVEERTVELTQSEGRLRHLIEHFSSGIYIHENFEPLYANRTLLEMLGYADVADFCAIGTTELVLAPEERERIWGYHQARLRGEPAPVSYDFWALKKNGERVLVNNRSFVVDWNGRRAVCTTLFDLTEQKKTEHMLAEQEHLLASLLASTDQGFWFIDVEGVATDVNPAMCKILGRDREDIVGRPIFDFVDDENADIFRYQINRRKIGARDAYEIALQRPDGVNVPCINNVSPLFNAAGDRSGSVGIWTDITDIKETQRSLELQTRNAQVASIAKSEFLAVASHELRTPMNGILGMAALLQRTDLTDDQRHRVEVIAQSGETLLRLLNDILDISKIEAGRVAIETTCFEVAGLMDGIQTLFRAHMEEKRLGFRYEIADTVPETVAADPNRIRQILTNLIGNAIKFTEAGEIAVSVAGEPAGGDQEAGGILRFEVSDTGIGIEPEKHGLVFEKFTQADASTSRNFGGTGLGLAICRELVEILGGEIGVESTPGEGTKFWFTVAFENSLGHAEAPAPAAREAVGADDDREFHPLRILVAEDNPVNQEILVDYAVGTGHCAGVVANGAEAVRAVEAGGYDLVLMDVQMPGMDGLEATRRIRAREEAQGLNPVYIAAVTANAFDSDREACELAGMNDFLSKPFSDDQFDAMLARATAVAAGARETAETPSSAAHPDNPVSGDSPLQDDIVEPLRRNKPDLWKRLVSVYLSNTPQSIGSIEQRILDGECAVVQFAAHSLKSASANMGASRLAELCRLLEGVAGEANLAPAESLLAEIKTEFGRVETFLVPDLPDSEQHERRLR